MHKDKIVESNTLILKLITLWAFSEIALGGLLHAMKIPFTGLFVGGLAVNFISLIFYYSEHRSTIIKSTILVVIIKAMVSPHVPIFAHLAVLFQGLMAYLILQKRFFKISVLILSLITMLISAFQKLITLTILFGKIFWESIDIFGAFVLKVFNLDSKYLSDHLHLIIIGIYVYLHLLGGFFFGIIAGRLPLLIKEKLIGISPPPIDFKKDEELKLAKQSKNSSLKKFFHKKIVLALFLIFMLLITYTKEAYFNSFLLMILRSFLIISIWIFLLSPKLKIVFNNFFEKQKGKNFDDIKKIMDFLPKVKLIIKYSWQYSQTEQKLKRLKIFFQIVLFYLLKND